MAHDVAPVGGIDNGAHLTRNQGSLDEGTRGVVRGPARGHFLTQTIEHLRVAHVGPERIPPVGVQGIRKRQARVGIRVQSFEFCDRIAHDVGYRHLLVHEPIHEGRVGAVFQQPPHQVGQQVLMLADGRVDANPREVSDLPRRFGVEEAAHAMQSLELEIGPFGRQFQD
jgi:hypothetical protein